MLNDPIKREYDEKRREKLEKRANVTEAVLAGILVALIIITYALAIIL